MICSSHQEVDQVSRLCALLPNYHLRKYSDEWDWWILGDFSTSILVAKLLLSCPKLASQSKTEFMIERFIFLSSTVLPPSPTLTINNAQLMWSELKKVEGQKYILHRQVLKKLSFQAAKCSRLTYPPTQHVPKSRRYDNSSTVKRFSSTLVSCELKSCCYKTQAVHTLTIQQGSHLRLIPAYTAQAFEVCIVFLIISGESLNPEPDCLDAGYK